MIKNKRVIVYDLETDGLSDKWNRVISFTALVITDSFTNFTLHSFHVKRRDNKPLPDFISKLTGLTTEIINNEGRPIEQAHQDISEIFGDQLDRVVVGHNIISFDNRFINHRFQKYDIDNEIFKTECFDTQRDYRATHCAGIKGAKFKLDVAFPALGCVPHWHRKVHTAEVDVAMTALLMGKQFINKGWIDQSDYNELEAFLVENVVEEEAPNLTFASAAEESSKADDDAKEDEDGIDMEAIYNM